MSCPRMVQAGWSINHNRQGLTVSDPRGRVLFMTRASPNGLHYLRGVQPLEQFSGLGRKIFQHADLTGGNNVDTNCVRPDRTTSLNLESATPSLISSSSSLCERERVNSIRVVPAPCRKIFPPGEEKRDDCVTSNREKATTLLSPSSTSESVRLNSIRAVHGEEKRDDCVSSNREKATTLLSPSSTSENVRLNSVRVRPLSSVASFFASSAESQPAPAPVCTSTPLESLFKCSGSESLVGCSNAVDLQHLYDSVASQCFHTCGSSFGEHYDQVRVSAQDNPLGRGLDEAFPHLPPCYFSRPWFLLLRAHSASTCCCIQGRSRGLCFTSTGSLPARFEKAHGRPREVWPQEF